MWPAVSLSGCSGTQDCCIEIGLSVWSAKWNQSCFQLLEHHLVFEGIFDIARITVPWSFGHSGQLA